jgi:DNA end-binding protein Ku
MPARSIDTATISFGLVTIPVKIYSSNEPAEKLHFHMVHADCGERLKQHYACPKHGEVERSDIIKGFELSKGNIVELEQAELKALEAVASDDIALTEFVPADAVDPLYIDASYYLGPDRGGQRAFQLFREALEQVELVGIASYAARGKQYVVMLRPYQDGLVMHQLRYADEVKPWSEIEIGKVQKPTSAELGLATSLIDSLRHETFDPSQYSDEVKDRVRKLIAQKAKGGEIARLSMFRVRGPDLMQALKARSAAPPPRRNGHERPRQVPALHGHAKPAARPAHVHTRRGRGRAPDARASWSPGRPIVGQAGIGNTTVGIGVAPHRRRHRRLWCVEPRRADRRRCARRASGIARRELRRHLGAERVRRAGQRLRGLGAWRERWHLARRWRTRERITTEQACECEPELAAKLA